MRIGQQLPIPVQQAKVHSPGVDADTGQGRYMALLCQGNALPDLAPETQNVPIQTIRQEHGGVGKAMGFGKPQSLAIEQAEHGPAALSTQVKG